MKPGALILVAEDDANVRGLISSVLEEAGYTTCAVSSGEAARDAARREHPRVVILDIHLPGVSGYEVCRVLREDFGDELPVMFLSGERTESFDRVAGLLIGADDYLTKPFAPDELLARVRGLIRRSAPSCRTLASKLTQRELEILRLLACGLDQEQIAEKLVISAKTVGTHIEHIFLKLGVRNRAQAVAFAFKGQLLDS